MVQLGAPHGEIVFPPPTPTEPYPELPVEVDDQYILPHQILGQPDGTVSLLSGFNHAVKIYMTMNPLVSVELSYGISSLHFNDQKTMLDECLQAVKQCLGGLPRELTLDMDAHFNNDQLGELSLLAQEGSESRPYYYYSPAHLAHQTPSDFRPIPGSSPERRKLLQCEIQKANIHTSQLATRSYYVERYLSLRDAHRDHTRAQAAQAYGPGNVFNGSGQGSGNTSKTMAAAALHAAAVQTDLIDASMTTERELIVQNLLAMLASISQRNMEPNGGSLINKIRQVASTLVNDVPERKGPLAMKADEPLSHFVELLMRLEKTGPGNPAAGDGIMTPQDEERELRNWADLREHQLRFFQNGRFISQI
jgi:hypothetical protein